MQVVLADTPAISSRDTLLEHITVLIRESAGSIFDATGGNPNVSLEVGVAHALGVDFLLTLNTRNPSRSNRARRGAGGGQRKADRSKPIIADLQGRNRIEYRSYAGLKKQVVERYLRRLPYWKRWDEFQRHHPAWIPPALLVFREIRLHGRVTRPRLEAVAQDDGVHLPGLLGALRQAGLIVQRRGRPPGYVYPTK